MTKLVFRYGNMNSAKTANLLMAAFSHTSNGKNILLMKPSIDERFDVSKIVSRIVPSMEANHLIKPAEKDFRHLIYEKDIVAVYVDEAQFLSIENVNGLRNLSLILPVYCYGLKTDYKSHLFVGSKRLLEIADTIEEVKTKCVHCGINKAIINAKYHMRQSDKVIVKEGSDDIELGAEEKYISLCWKCWLK